MNSSGNHQTSLGKHQGPAAIVNEKYKTQKCRHFENQGKCDLGDKCHFAHGDNELRKITDVSLRSIPFHRLPSIDAAELIQWEFSCPWIQQFFLLVFACSQSRMIRKSWPMLSCYIFKRQTTARTRASIHMATMEQAITMDRMVEVITLKIMAKMVQEAAEFRSGSIREVEVRSFNISQKGKDQCKYQEVAQWISLAMNIKLFLRISITTMVVLKITIGTALIKITIAVNQEHSLRR